MQQMHKVLCKLQGKAKTAQVPAQKLAASGLTTFHLWHSWPKPQAERCSMVPGHSWLLPAQRELHPYTLEMGQEPTYWKRRTPHTPTSGQPYL